MFKGLWFWSGDIDDAIGLAQQMGANTMVLKAAYHDPAYTGPLKYRADFAANAQKCGQAGLLVAAEVFSIPRTCREEGQLLRRAVLGGGALSVVLNAEPPHEADSGDGVQRFLEAFSGAAPLFAATDFRGDRLARPYHVELAKAVAGWMPMVYPHAFYPDRPFGDLQRAFDDVYWQWRELGPRLPEPGRSAPLYPVIQAYDRRDYEETVGQVVLAWRWGAAGTSIYASHDVNPRAKWGVRDGWELVAVATERAALTPAHKIRLAEAARVAVLTALG